MAYRTSKNIENLRYTAYDKRLKMLELLSLKQRRIKPFNNKYYWK